MSYHKQLLGAAIILALSACGGGGNNAANSAASAAASAAAAVPSAAASAAAAAGNAMTGGAMGVAPVPADLSCGAVKPVWVNTKTHVYHTVNDPMYGKTKAGKYMCPSAAKAEGDRAAGGAMMTHPKSKTN